MNEKTEVDEAVISLSSLIFRLKNVITFIKSKWKYFLITIFFGILVAVIYTKTQKIKYIATLSYYLDEESSNKSSSSTLGLLASQFGGGNIQNAGNMFSKANFTDLLKSKMFIERILLKKYYFENHNATLIDHYLKINKTNIKSLENENRILFDSVDNRDSLTKEQNLIIDEVYNQIIENLNFQPLQQSSIFFTIKYKNTNEKFAKFFCENVITEASFFYIDTKSKKAKLNVDIIQKQIDSIRFVLDNSITSVAVENDQIFNLNRALLKKGTNPNKKQIDVQANTAILNSLILSLGTAKSELLEKTPLIQIIDKPQLPLKQESDNFFKILLFSIFFSCMVMFIIIISKKI